MQRTYVSMWGAHVLQDAPACARSLWSLLALWNNCSTWGSLVSVRGSTRFLAFYAMSAECSVNPVTPPGIGALQCSGAGANCPQNLLDLLSLFCVFVGGGGAADVRGRHKSPMKTLPAGRTSRHSSFQQLQAALASGHAKKSCRSHSEGAQA